MRLREINPMNLEVKTKVAFICVHNSCRSQIAEALGKLLAADVFESYSAGTDINWYISDREFSQQRMAH